MQFSTVGVFKNLPSSGRGIVVEGMLLKDLQSVLMEMLIDIDEVCRQNGIEYQLGGGSCLGAVRHSGFIPWDDDIDINMVRSDYLRFSHLVRRDLDHKYELQDPFHTNDYGLGFARLRRKGTLLRTREDLTRNDTGVCIDIFMIDNVPDQPILRLFHGFGSLVLGFMLSCRRFAQNEKSYMLMAGEDSKIRRVFRRKAAIGKAIKFLSVDALCRAWDRWNSWYRNTNSVRVSVPAGRKHYWGEMHKRGVYLPSVEGSFEGVSIRIPNNSSAYLGKLYGDFMQIPEEANRESHVVLEIDLGDVLQ